MIYARYVQGKSCISTVDWLSIPIRSLDTTVTGEYGESAVSRPCHSLVQLKLSCGTEADSTHIVQCHHAHLATAASVHRLTADVFWTAQLLKERQRLPFRFHPDRPNVQGIPQWLPA